MAARSIQLRGVRVHNLKEVDVDIPHGQLVVLCGVSGGGKTSLALDTLYAEGQRRFVESFSAYTRQFLQRLEKPDAEHIDGLPPAVAVTSRTNSRSSRATIATSTEIYDNLRLLFARIGQIVCGGCGQLVRRDSAEDVARELGALPEGTRYMLAFPHTENGHPDHESLRAALLEDGYQRVVAGGRAIQLADEALPALDNGHASDALLVVVDRLTAGQMSGTRLRDSVETAFAAGRGRCVALVSSGTPKSSENGDHLENNGSLATSATGEVLIDGRPWKRLGFSSQLRCEACGIDYQPPDPKLFSFNSPLGACPTCEGFGNTVDIDMDLVVPDVDRPLRGGAIAPWTTPAYAHELEELIDIAADVGVRVDVPFKELTPEELRIIHEGVPEKKFGGLSGFFAWLERRKYKTHIRVFLSRWRSYRPCPACHGARLRPESLVVKLAGKNISDVCQLRISDARDFFASLKLDAHDRQIARMILEQTQARLRYLQSVGLDYLSLNRTLRTLSVGEAQRVALTAALGSNLVNMLYVLDEPSVGLHPHDVGALVGAIKELRDRGNTVVVVEHEEAILRAADQLIEIGPGAGKCGGEIVFQGTIDEMLDDEESLTGAYLAGRRGVSIPIRRPNAQGRVKITAARGNNLKRIDVEFPLGLLCLVTGVSGSGKSTLVQHTLYGALCHRKRKEGPAPLPYSEVIGDGQIDDIVLVDQGPIGRSPRSNPVTYIKAFDAIRAVFAETIEARTHNYTIGHFSFNAEEGRCSACAGDGYKEIDMQFMADVLLKCPVCQGRRYRKEILEVHYRDRNIADVLEMTVREAFNFFRGQTKVLSRLKPLIDVGLDYLTLGQPASTLSAGEAQRLKLASYLGAKKRGRTLFILDEPTTGLHFSDVVRLLDCFEALLSVGHSLIVVEHNLQMMKAADWIIDLGPGAGDMGGTVVASGTPEQVAENPASFTGQFLREALAAGADD